MVLCGIIQFGFLLASDVSRFTGEYDLPPLGIPTKQQKMPWQCRNGQVVQLGMQ